ncbi:MULTISPECIES: hypothetical protein [unclassified Hyphomonas]|uniref:hypothetical protein n=1 Tax=unclassified Hyphomonas TaxID=2630699 RepID=UPI000458F741|nr:MULTISPECIES: hypothetical protein [unclassified Hyphomonas]KCZ49548.1 hypothetical protein HY17_00195 [Hyphomonas sp. CY54-11-8]
MMTMTLLAVAAMCLAFAGFCLFGLPYMIAGPRVLDQLRGRLTDKALLAGLVTAAISLVWVLQASPALISHGPSVQVVADQMTGGSWQV